MYTLIKKPWLWYKNWCEKQTHTYKHIPEQSSLNWMNPDNIVEYSILALISRTNWYLFCNIHWLEFIEKLWKFCAYLCINWLFVVALECVCRDSLPSFDKASSMRLSYLHIAVIHWEASISRSVFVFFKETSLIRGMYILATFFYCCQETQWLR